MMNLVELKGPGVLAGIRWPDGGVLCLRCGAPCRKDGLRTHGRIKIQQYICTACATTMNEYSGTILEGSTLDAADLLALYAWTGRHFEERPSLRRMAMALRLSPETVRQWVRSALKSKDHWGVLRRKSMRLFSVELFGSEHVAVRIEEIVPLSRIHLEPKSISITWKSGRRKI